MDQIPAPNPWTFEDWNLTAQGQYLVLHGLIAASKLAQAAGTTVGGPRPKPKQPLQVEQYILNKRLGRSGSGNASSVTVGFANADYIVSGSACQTQINTAIAAVSAAGGGVVHVKRAPGSLKYNLTAAIRLKNGVTLEGEGSGTTFFLITASNTRMLQNDDDLGNSDFCVRSIKFDGNGINQDMDLGGAGQGTVDVMHFQFSTNFSVEDCHIVNANRHSCFVSDSCSAVRILRNRMQDPVGLSNIAGFNSSDIVVSGNTNSGAAQTGVKLDTCHTCAITGNVFFNNSTIQIYVTGGSSTAISGNAVRGGQNGVRVVSQDFTTITGNSLRDHSEHGIALLQNCDDTLISSNMIRDCGGETMNTFDGINIDDIGNGCIDTLISANLIVDTKSKMRCGIKSLNGSNFVIYGNNIIRGFQTSAVSLVGANNHLNDA